MKFINTIIVGSGAAGMNAAISLHKKGVTNIAIVTEGVFKGTSHNTGSDKQTYFKQMTSGEKMDSVQSMTEDLFAGGAMDGDLALCEASLSLKSFYHLVDIGVPFPDNEYGEFYGYKTDHDTKTRGVSAGPLTSKYMTKCLKKEIDSLGITILEGYQAIKIVTVKDRIAGFIALDRNNKSSGIDAMTLFSCQNLIWATGGAADMYGQSVYPVSQHGSTGIALEAGILGKNVTESQFGLASIKFRWNLSGTFQQVIPRYISCDQEGNDSREFMEDYFNDSEKMSSAIFLKGYQWPFNADKIDNQASSYIDLLVYNEIYNKKRRVYLDFRYNPTSIIRNGLVDFELLESTAYDYLRQSNALLDKPIERLNKMNNAAIQLYKEQGIDLYAEPLEIAICAQHNNGGLSGDSYWESNVSHFFCVGEVNGTHGVYRPGGSALNSGQCGSERAALRIAEKYKDSPNKDANLEAVYNAFVNLKKIFNNRIHEAKQKPIINLKDERMKLHKRMDACGGPIRVKEDVSKALEESKRQLELLNECKLESKTLHLWSILRDSVISSYVYLSAIDNYISKNGASRGSYLVLEDRMQFDEIVDNAITPDEKYKNKYMDQIQEVAFNRKELEVNCFWRDVREIPERETWFENVWNSWKERNEH